MLKLYLLNGNHIYTPLDRASKMYFSSLSVFSWPIFLLEFSLSCSLCHLDRVCALLSDPNS